MALFTKDTIDRVRDAVDMVHLVGQKTDLRRVGTRWTGLCPFHDERTPSFSVNPVEKLYYCFGCSEGGDAFKFVQQTEALDFQEAVELLAERFNVRVEREADDPRAEERRRRRERLHALLERAAGFYAIYLRESTEAAHAREYLASRALSEEVTAEFRVGYSPSAWDRMIMGARQNGFSEEKLVAAGLAQRPLDLVGRRAEGRARRVGPAGSHRAPSGGGGRPLAFACRHPAGRRRAAEPRHREPRDDVLEPLGRRQRAAPAPVPLGARPGVAHSYGAYRWCSMRSLPSGSVKKAMWQTPVSRMSPANVTPLASSSARAAATSST